MAVLQWVLIFIHPHRGIESRRFTLMPGVNVEPISADFLALVKENLDKMKIIGQPRFESTHILKVDPLKYSRGVIARLIAAGWSREQLERDFTNANYPKEGSFGIGKYDNPVQGIVMHHEIAKHILISLALMQRVTFEVGPICSVDVRQRSHLSKDSFQGAGCIFLESASDLMTYTIPFENPNPINISDWRKTIDRLEPYFRPTHWQVDRMATALSCFWSALCTPFPEHVFLSLTTLFEALLSTNSTEITHTIAERSAFLLGANENERYEQYLQMKRLYDIRSKIVHGGVVFKKGPNYMETLSVDAKRSNVPTSKIAEMLRLSMRLLNAILCKHSLMQIIQQKASHDKITKDLNEFYLRLGFR